MRQAFLDIFRCKYLKYVYTYVILSREILITIYVCENRNKTRLVVLLNYMYLLRQLKYFFFCIYIISLTVINSNVREKNVYSKNVRQKWSTDKNVQTKKSQWRNCPRKKCQFKFGVCLTDRFLEVLFRRNFQRAEPTGCSK